ncbi:hypothetical protein OBBRIDRAFT_723894, partial [Obba rivulosa]
ILYYDYSLTLPMEVARYWLSGRGITWAAALFFIVRYLSILGHIPVMVQVFWPSYSAKVSHILTSLLCLNLQMYHQLLSVIVQVLVGALLIMRTYALYGRNRAVLWLLVSVASGVIAVGCVSNTFCRRFSEYSSPVFKGKDLTSTCRGIHFMAAWSGMLVFDLVVFLFTLVKCIKLGRLGRRTLLDIFVRDGQLLTYSTSCMAAANLSNILTFLVSPLVKGVATIFTNIISTTLISRLMLNLRDPKILSPQNTMTFGSSTAPSTPFVSSLGFTPDRRVTGRFDNSLCNDVEAHDLPGTFVRQDGKLGTVSMLH